VSQRHDLAGAITYKYRLLRADLRYYLTYPPEVLNTMTMQELAEAWNDILFVHKQMKKEKND
jgi:hypothetical protein